MEQLRQCVREFLRRDYENDVEVLNRALARDGKATAGFVSAPPSVLTGDPYSLSPGNCIGVTGLNPMWHADAQREADRTIAELNEDRMTAYESRRARFFDDGSEEYNPHHFSRLGNRLRNAGLDIPAATPRDVFRNHAFVTDLLPWWSTNIDAIDPRKLSTAIEPLAAWHTVLTYFLRELRPSLLIVHGSAFRRLAETLLDVELQEFRYAGNRRAWAGTNRTHEIPVLMHGQVTAIRGPQSDTVYQNLISTWRN